MQFLTVVIAEAIFNVLFDESMSAKIDTAEIATKAVLQAIDQAGYVVVPKEPTPAMIESAHNCIAGDTGTVSDVYRAMLSASKEE